MNGRRIGRSVLAVFIGFTLDFLLSAGGDLLFHALHVFPPWNVPFEGFGICTLAASYRVVFTILSGYVVAKFAPRNPMKHVWALAIIGFVLGMLGVWLTYTHHFGSMGYAWAVVLTGVPSALLGGWLAVRKTR